MRVVGFGFAFVGLTAVTALGCSVGEEPEPYGQGESAQVARPEDESDCVDPPPPPRPASCYEMDALCGWGSAITLAQDMYAQMVPGCGPLELGSTLVCDGLGGNRDPDRALETATIWACNVIACLGGTGPRAPQIAALQATCAAGNALNMAIRCNAATALCLTETANARGLGCGGIAEAYPCPYRPSVAACGPADSIRSDSDITADCARVVDGYGVSGPVHGQCMASCVRATTDARVNCPRAPVVEGCGDESGNDESER